MSALMGTDAVRYITAEVLADLDALGIDPQSLRVEFSGYDRRPRSVEVWFFDYADAQRYADHLGIGDRVTFNGGSDSRLLHLSRTSWESGRPVIAGVQLGVHLICDRPEVAA